jgi:predicted DNA-binding protein with PD1-like motif
MTFQELPSGYVLRFFHGEEIVAGLTAFCRERSLTAGWVNGLGALARAELGYYDLETRTYIRRTFEEDLELAPLMGNVSRLDGGPFFHLHATLGRKDFGAYAGHLFLGVAGATVEVALFAFPGHAIERRRDENIGLNLWALPKQGSLPG